MGSRPGSSAVHTWMIAQVTAASGTERTAVFDKEGYKGRNVVERNFNTFKQWRCLAGIVG